MEDETIIKPFLIILADLNDHALTYLTSRDHRELTAYEQIESCTQTGAIMQRKIRFNEIFFYKAIGFTHKHHNLESLPFTKDVIAVIQNVIKWLKAALFFVSYNKTYFMSFRSRQNASAEILFTRLPITTKSFKKAPSSYHRTGLFHKTTAQVTRVFLPVYTSSPRFRKNVSLDFFFIRKHLYQLNIRPELQTIA